MKSATEYKELTVKEFSKAADIYETGHAGIYEMCKDDYQLFGGNKLHEEIYSKNRWHDVWYVRGSYQ